MIEPHKAIDFIIKHGKKYAKAKAERIYLDEYKKSKKALLMAESTAEAANAREQYAYAHPEYLEVLAGIKAAVEVEEELRWHLIAAQARIEVFRTEEASARAEGRAVK